jgi:hypothetical protein
VASSVKQAQGLPDETRASADKVCEIINEMLKKRDVGVDSQIQVGEPPASAGH